MAAVLLVNDYWKRNDKSRQTLNQINTTLSQRLDNRGVKTYSTTLALKEDDDDLKHARTKGVIIIQPQPTKRKKEPEISWLGEYHARHFPNLPTDVDCIVGYSATTLDVASILKEERYPDSKLVVINTIKPQQAEEDGQHLSDDYSFYDNVDVVFSFGKATHARFLALKEQENLAPDAKIYDEVEVISALCGGLGASAATPTEPSLLQLGRNYSTLVKNMDGKHILKYLVEDSIISVEKQREMKEEAGQRKQLLNELILDEIVGGGERAVRSLCSALRQDDVKQDHLADKLEPKTEMPNEERRAYDSLLQMFREDILKHVIILYTYGDDFEKKAERHNKTLEDYVFNDRNPKWFKELLEHVKNRYLIFDNYTDDPYKREAQRTKLLQKILEVMAGTKNQPYNNKYTKLASEMCEEAQLALEQDKRQMAASTTNIKATEQLPEESKANQKIDSGTKPKVMFNLPATKKPKKKKRGGKKHAHKDTVQSQDVSGKTVAVLGHEDDESAGEWIERQPRPRRSNPNFIHIRRSLSMPASKPREKLPVQDPKDVAARVVDKDVEEAVATIPQDVSNQIPPPQPRGGVPTNNAVSQVALINQKADELLTLVKQDKGQGKVIMERLQKEVEKDADDDCLPSSSSVLVIDSTGEATEVSLSSVSMGDKVKVSADTFEPVFLFSHAVEDVLSTYISFTTEGGKTVALSQSHLITVIKGEKNVTVAAREITEGDKLFTVKESTGCLVPDKVVSARYVLKSGQYCPHTYSGYLIVNGVYVSCYTDKLPLRLGHGLLVPLGWLHRSCPRLFRLLCTPEETDGVPWWMSKLDDILTWWRSG
ncbi:gTPase, IMAP member 8 [Branchiostoma belcheri]|nr:gTPase, IMAP member 8 [Branchiostoma belcheri]